MRQVQYDALLGLGIPRERGMEESNKKHSTKSYSYGSNKSNMNMLYWDMEGRGVEESGSEKRKAKS